MLAHRWEKQAVTKLPVSCTLSSIEWVAVIFNDIVPIAKQFMFI